MALHHTLRSIFATLGDSLASPDELSSLLKRLGWTFTIDEFLLQNGPYAELATLVGNIGDLAEDLGDGDISLADMQATTALAQSAWATLHDLMDTPPIALPDADTVGAFEYTMTRELPDLLLCSFLQYEFPAFYTGLKTLGLVQEAWIEFEPESAFRVDYQRRTIRWDRLFAALGDPLTHVQQVYRWNGAHFADEPTGELRANLLIGQLAELATAAGLNAAERTANADLFPSFADWLRDPDDNETLPPRQLELLLVDAMMRDPDINFAVGLALGPFVTNGAVDGLSLTNLSRGSFTGTIPLFAPLVLDVAAEGDADGIGRVDITPSGVTTVVDPSAGSASGEVILRVGGGAPWTLFGRPGGSRLNLTGGDVSLAAMFSAPEPEFRVGGGVGLHLVIHAGEGDSFISSVLGGLVIESEAEIRVLWSSINGLSLSAEGGLEIIVPLGRRIGPILLERIRLAAGLSPEGLEISAGVTGSIDLNVLQFLIDDIGLRTRLSPIQPGQPPGLFDMLDLLSEFKPPRGLGLTIDAAGLVSGGGYLSVDADAGRYSGVGEVQLLTLGLSAIGIVETRLPDNPRAWSLFLAIFSEFPPIQIGFGFTLNGVGGLVGLNRAIDEDALFERLLTGGLDSVMFPDDPVANAPAILDDIGAIFPAADGQFLFGAMFKLGWGAPTVLELDLGLIVELPSPFRALLLGQLAALLPKPDAAVVELNMDVAGLLDFTAGTFELVAALRDSHIAGIIHLSGGMAVTAVFEGRPDMILSIGGFHPRYVPPPGFRTPARITAQIPVGDIADISLSGYIAITSNTFQMGGRIDIYAEVSGFTAEGWLGFDALIQFTPFAFDVGVDFGVSVRNGNISLLGIDIHAQVTGPSPIHIRGEAEFEFLEITKRIELDLLTGGQQAAVNETENVSDLLTTALEADDALMAVSGQLPVRLVGTAAGIDPGASLTLVQKIAPLDFEIERFGAATVAGPTQFSIGTVTLNGRQLAPDQVSQAMDWFAPAMFVNMTDAEKLKAASFKEYSAGVEIAVADLELSGPVAVDASYEEIVLGTAKSRRSRQAKSVPLAKLAQTMQARHGKLTAPAAGKPALKVSPPGSAN